VTDYIFSCPELGADLALQRFAPVYAYEFADENAPEPFLPPVSFPYAAAHASELQFLWNRFVGSNPQLTPAELTLAQTMKTYWTEFATTHQPSVPGLPLWSPFAPSSENIQSLVPPTPGVTHGFAADHKCAFWSQLEGGQQQPSMQRIRDAERRLGLVR
jgi:para-nitrobenzyl esterase